ncbi:related to ADA2 - general transcriptional adaptor or co-activator [Melanopsichium pennsylvanicum]|uniref:Related to ADA2 - general transcriptional adaptor or co-activator n=2 Tax=Melanopsichium pennsylvanicum TaxID=63383 RepID=A0AAJ4XML5_9BASI|nr:related to ADA2 - general transcriptional adaptor or co-activator [Melanopsichium pennsylvanicum]
MTVSHRKNKKTPKSDDGSTSAAAEPGVRYHCDACGADITLTVRIRCAECADFDLCASCFCSGAQPSKHKAWHDYRVVEQHSYPIFCDDWGADEELLLIDGCQTYGLGNWADIADHIGNRTKEEVQEHYITVYVEGRDGGQHGQERAQMALETYQRVAKPVFDPLTDEQGTGSRVACQLSTEEPPVVGPSLSFIPSISQDEFQRRKRRRVETLREAQASYSPPKSAKPLVSAPTNHSELVGFMPGRLEFEHEYEQEAEHLIKDIEFGRVYEFGGADMPSEWEALGSKATQGHARMEASGRGGPTSKKATQNAQDDKQANADGEAADDQPATADQEDKDKDKDAEPEDKPFDWDEDPTDLHLKLTVIDMYNERLDRRLRRKHFIFERNLVDYRRNQAAERRRIKEERELLSRTKHFAQMQTALDYEDFINGLCYEEALRKAAAQLQHYRKVGILTLDDASTYERDKAERARKAAEVAAGGLAAFPASGAAATPIAASARPRIDAARARQRDTSTPTPMEETLAASSVSAAASISTANGKDGKKDKDAATTVTSTTAKDIKSDKDKSKKGGANGDEPKTPRKPPQPLNLAQAPSLNLLTPAEAQLCSALRILPQPFLLIKSTLIAEFIARGGRLTRRECRTLVKIDVNKLGKVWDFFNEMGYFDAARQAGWTGGIGSPPRSKDKQVKKPDWLDGSMAMSASYSFVPCYTNGGNGGKEGNSDGMVNGISNSAGGGGGGGDGLFGKAFVNGSAGGWGGSGSETGNGGGLFDLAAHSGGSGVTSTQQQQALMMHNGRGAPLVSTAANTNGMNGTSNNNNNSSSSSSSSSSNSHNHVGGGGGSATPNMSSGRSGSQSPSKAEKYRPTAAV